MSTYIDQYGVIWVKISHATVKRLDNGCLGGWMNGKGLVEL